MRPLPSTTARVRPGRPVLQLPGPTDVPEQVLRAIAAPTIDHRGEEFAALVSDLLPRLAGLFGSRSPVVIYPSSATGAWEAALVNTCSPGDRVIAFDSGYFARAWARLATGLGLKVALLPAQWSRGVDLPGLERALGADRTGEVRAVMVVHNETATGVTAPVAEVRALLDRLGHPALLLVDAVSSAPSVPYQHDGWGVDVTVCGSQKGLMLPPGLGLNVVGPGALARHGSAGLPRGYWDWTAVLEANADGGYPYTPATNLLFGLRTAVGMLAEEGPEAVHDRHARLGRATRAAVRAWGLAPFCADPDRYSDTVTAVTVPTGADPAEVCRAALELGNLTLARGLGPTAGSVFRIGHLGHCGPAQLLGALGVTELALRAAGIPATGGTEAALAALA
jgi:alanine-glyoxylate transaminase / serine-glyoxylate transaminase / serine-pyruvate transaminase